MTTHLKHWLLIAFVVVASSTLVWLFVGTKSVYQNFDGPYYLVVAKSWYDKAVVSNHFSFSLPLEYYPAHFPFYPLLIVITSSIGLTLPQAMVAVTVVFAFAGAVLVYKIFETYNWGSPLAAAIIWLFFWPRMWAVRSVGSPETLFIFLVYLSLLTFDRKKYWLAAIFGTLATLTKSPGILLVPTYLLWQANEFIKTKKVQWKAWPVLLIGAGLVGLFAFFSYRTGDFFAYFHSGDNIHLQLLPFRVFDRTQPWVNTVWLEEVLWVYLVAGIGVIKMWRKNTVFGAFGVVFLTTILFISHRDISRYSLPLVPVVLVGLSSLWNHREVRWVLGFLLIPMFFYTVNFVSANLLPISDWAPFLH